MQLDRQISIRVGPDELAALERVEKVTNGAIKRARLARIAMRIGLAALERDPALFFKR